MFRERSKMMPINQVKKSLFFTLTALVLMSPATGLPASPKRIVSLAPSLTEIICDLGMSERLVAVTDYCDYPPEVIKKPKVGGFANPSLEMIVSLKPDLVVLTEDGNPKSLNDRLRNIGIETYIFRARRIKELPGAIVDVGVALGIPKRAELKARRFVTRLDRFEKRARKHSAGKAKTAVFIVQPVPLVVAGKETVMDDAFTILGIENIGATGGKGYPKFSVEQVIRLEPDVLFFGKATRMEERSKPLLNKLAFLPAVREGKVFFLDVAVYRLGPRIVDIMQEISDSMYP